MQPQSNAHLNATSSLRHTQTRIQAIVIHVYTHTPAKRPILGCVDRCTCCQIHQVVKCAHSQVAMLLSMLGNEHEAYWGSRYEKELACLRAAIASGCSDPCETLFVWFGKIALLLVLKPFLMMGLFCKIDTCSSLLLHIPAARFMYLFLRRAQFISTVRKHTSQNIAILRQSSHLHSGVSDDCERRAWPLQRQLRLTGLGLWQRIHVRRCIIFHFSTLHALYSALF
jgi:hypothetical protein